MSVDNKRVREIVNDAIMRAGSGGGDACCGKIYQAWRNLKAWRDQPPAGGARPNSLDLEVAAAENYMFARWCVCKGLVNRLQMNTMAIGYYASKVIGSKMPTSGNPQSDPDSGVLGWGGIGSEEGEADRTRCNPTADPPLWRPVNEIMDLRSGYGSFYGSPGTRYDGPTGYTPPGYRS